MRKLGFISNEEVVDYEAVIMNPAYVHINKKSSDATKRYKQELAKKNIYSIGRYGSWYYCSIEDNIIEAKALAKTLSK
jgi:protoporphyrinogen oxidase